jgi:hypothetical protein
MPRTRRPKDQAGIPARGGVGISNRESPAEEEQERREFPPVDTRSPAPQDASGRTGSRDVDLPQDHQTSHKAGSRSVAQKESGSRYPDRSAPNTHKVPGAFGREGGASERDKGRRGK